MRWPSVRYVLVAGLFLATLSSRAVVLDPPQLRCVSVNAVGDVTLTWIVPPDPGGDFSSYEVYHATAQGGPYALLTTVPVYGQTTFFHAAAGAGAGPQFYYMTTTTTSAPPNVSVSSDTLSTIYLQVTQSAPLGDAVLNWTPPHVPPLATASANYTIWMEYPIGTWQQIAQVPNNVLSFQYEISICSDSLTFRVGLADDLGCVSFSNLDGDEFADASPPSSPVIIAVSVDTTTGLATITWSPSPEGDTDAYIILFNNSLGNVIVDTVYGQFNTTYTWLGSNAGSMAEGFTVAAFDTCWTGSPPSPNTSPTLPPHKTIHATTTYDRCGGDVTISWTPYVGWAVQEYRVYASQNGNAFFLLGTFPATTTSVAHLDVAPFATYCYVVKAIQESGAGVSLSNKACRLADYPAIPQWNYIRTVDVIEEDHILVVDSVDVSAQVKRYRLWRSTNGEPFTQVAQQAGGGGPVIYFDDTDVETGKRSYVYRIAVDDSCGTEVLTSNIGTSIFLRAQPELTGINHLLWNGYEDWAGVVSGFTVYRSVDDQPYLPIAVTAATDWYFDDDVSLLLGSDGRFCYIVEANEAANPSGVNAVARSNEVCAVQEESVYIPNAFIAGGVNDSFIPVLAYADVDGYELIIYNRWGQNIWSTTDRTQAWDGQVNGHYVPQGVYPYYCTFRNGAGKTVEKRGTVTFIWGKE